MKLEIAKKSLAVLEPGQKRQVVMELIETYPVRPCARCLDYPRSQVYYRPQAADDESELERSNSHVGGPASRPMAYRRITAMLKRQGQGGVNHKRVARL